MATKNKRYYFKLEMYDNTLLPSGKTWATEHEAEVIAKTCKDAMGARTYWIAEYNF